MASIKVEQDAAGGLLKEMGFKAATKWPAKKLGAKLNKIGNLLEDEEVDKPKSSTGNRLLKQLLEAKENGKKIIVIAEGESDDDDDGDDDKKGKKAKAKKGSKEKSAPRGDPADKDEWGCREGSSAAAINAVLLKSKKPLESSTIAEKADTTPARVNGHMRAMIEKGYAKKTDEGYVARAGKSKK